MRHFLQVPHLLHSTSILQYYNKRMTNALSQTANLSQVGLENKKGKPLGNWMTKMVLHRHIICLSITVEVHVNAIKLGKYVPESHWYDPNSLYNLF